MTPLTEAQALYDARDALYRGEGPDPYDGADILYGEWLGNRADALAARQPQPSADVEARVALVLVAHRMIVDGTDDCTCGWVAGDDVPDSTPYREYHAAHVAAEVARLLPATPSDVVPAAPLRALVEEWRASTASGHPDCKHDEDCVACAADDLAALLPEPTEGGGDRG